MMLTTPPKDYPLDDTHLWVLDASQLEPALLDTYLSLLSPDERNKTFATPARQHLYYATRVLARLLLARYCDLPPNTLLFAHQPSGKPYLTNAELQFNISHCDKFVLIAIHRHAELGVDIEKIKARKNLMAIAQRFFHVEEIAQLKNLSDADQIDYFFKVWTLKEAFYKGLGSGIATGLDRTIFKISDKITAQTIDDSELFINEWQFYQTTLFEEFYLALAVKQSQPLTPILWNANALF